jgi:hypothetical protein
MYVWLHINLHRYTNKYLSFLCIDIRFIRFGARAFANWRLFATFKRKARKAREKYWHIQEKLIIECWIDWIRIKGIFLFIFIFADKYALLFLFMFLCMSIHKCV